MFQSVLQAVGAYHFMKAFPFGVIICWAFVQRLFRLSLNLSPALVMTEKTQRPEMSRGWRPIWKEIMVRMRVLKPITKSESPRDQEH